jgi:hypothetical protein
MKIHQMYFGPPTSQFQGLYDEQVGYLTVIVGDKKLAACSGFPEYATYGYAYSRLKQMIMLEIEKELFK